MSENEDLKMFGISRVDSNKGHYWFVRLGFKRNKPGKQKIFSDSVYNGKEKALEIATKWRDENFTGKKKEIYIENSGLENSIDQSQREEWKKERERRRFQAIEKYGRGKIYLGTGIEAAKKARELGASKVTCWKIKSGIKDSYQPDNFLKGIPPLKEHSNINRKFNNYDDNLIKKEKIQLLHNKCIVEKCDNLTRNLYGKYCNRHDLQMRRHGYIFDDLKPIPDLSGEEWKWIKGYEGRYKISNRARIKSFVRGYERLLKPQSLPSTPSLHIVLGKSKVGPISITALMIKHFYINNPFNEKRVMFIDGNSKNCSIENLTYPGAYWHNKTKTVLSSLLPNKEAKCILDCMDGNKEAIEMLFLRQRKKVYKHIYYRIKNYPKSMKGSYGADDIVQESLIKALSAIKRGLLRDISFIDQWFKVIASNTLINISKKEDQNLYDNQWNDYNEDFSLIDMQIGREYMQTGYWQ
jgi:hypothetical protein